MKAIQIIIGWLLDVWLGDPAWLPHPVVLFGKMIARGEHALNKGQHRRLKGALLAITLVLLVFCVTWLLLKLCAMLSPWLSTALQIILIFFCLAGTTLIREVRQVFIALDRSLEEGRQQVARIVGRDTTQLTAQEVRKAALETLAENLSDGVIAPMFWYLLLGVPGMMAYKMVNTLDSMIGYHSERYLQFKLCQAIWPLSRQSQLWLSRVSFGRHPRLSLRRTSHLFRRSIRQTLYWNQRS